MLRQEEVRRNHQQEDAAGRAEGRQPDIDQLEKLYPAEGEGDEDARRNQRRRDRQRRLMRGRHPCREGEEHGGDFDRTDRDEESREGRRENVKHAPTRVAERANRKERVADALERRGDVQRFGDVLFALRSGLEPPCSRVGEERSQQPVVHLVARLDRFVAGEERSFGEREVA